MARRLVSKPINHKTDVVAVRLEDVVPDPDQPRKTFAPDGLAGLANSLTQTGQISPLVVRPAPGGKYVIVVGERRWQAAKEAGLSDLQCILRYDIDEQKAREMQLAENYHREDIPPLEQARALKAYLETYNVSQRELSRRTGIPQRTISDRLALLSLPVSVHAQIEAGEIGPYEAVKVAALPLEQQEAVAEALVSGQIGGRDLEKPIKPRKFPHTGDRMTEETPETVDVLEANMSLSQRLDNLEKAVYKLAATYAFNEAAEKRDRGPEEHRPVLSV